MELKIDERAWNQNEHFRSIHDGEWLPMLDPEGNAFPGIEGKRGVRGIKDDGSYIGCDYIYMQPSSRFPLHVHEGEHEIYFIDGSGFVHINGEDVAVTAGNLIHIPAEYPHGVFTRGDFLIFAATGHPHHHVHARDRMRVLG